MNPKVSSPKKILSPIRLQLPALPALGKAARDFIYQTSVGLGLSKRGAYELKLASGEAFNNIIVHAYEGKFGQPIFIEINAYSSYLEVQLTDLGIQKPISSNLARDLGDYRTSGLGLFIINKFTDHHHYDQERPRGTRLTLKKKLS